MKKSLMALLVLTMFTTSAYADKNSNDITNNYNTTNRGGEGGQGGTGIGVGVGIAGASSSSSAIGGGANVDVRNTSTNLNNNTNLNSSSNVQGQIQGQGQKQSTENSNNTNINVQGDNFEARRIPVSTAFAPSIAPTANCALSVSGGVSVIGFSGSFGKAYIDENCAALEKVRNVALVLKDVNTAEAMMCQDKAYAKARATAGRACPVEQE